jgi:hypothetical protein
MNAVECRSRRRRLNVRRIISSLSYMSMSDELAFSFDENTRETSRCQMNIFESS